MLNNRIMISALIIMGYSSVAVFNLAYGDQTIINNNMQQTAPPAPQSPSSPCNNGATPNDGLRAGAYTTKNSYGGTDQLYTTGDKQPFNVDGNCNNQSTVVQPYIYAQPPGFGPGPGPNPGPRPMPHR